MKNTISLIFLLALGAPAVSFSQETNVGHDHESEKVIYQCPMHPEVKSDKPGVCPICQMKLVKVASSENDSSRKDSESKTTGGDSEPKTKKVKFYRHPMNPSILSQTPAKDEMGMDYVPVYEDSAEGSNKSDVSGRASLHLTAEQRDNMKLKLTLAQVRELGRELRMPGRIISQAQASLQVFEQDLGWIVIGNPVEVEVASYPGRVFQGKVLSIDSVLDPMTRTARVLVSLLSRDAVMRTETSVVATIQGNIKKRLVIPESAVFSTGNEDYVFLSSDGLSYTPKKVMLGVKSNGNYEVVEGLKEGDQLSAGPNFLIDSESRVQFSVQNASGGGQ